MRTKRREAPDRVIPSHQVGCFHTLNHPTLHTVFPNSARFVRCCIMMQQLIIHDAAIELSWCNNGLRRRRWTTGLTRTGNLTRKNGLPATKGFLSWHNDVPMIGLRPLYWGNNKQTGDLPAILNAFHAVFPFLTIFSALGPMCLAIFSYICIMLASSLYETAATQTDHSYY